MVKVKKYLGVTLMVNISLPYVHIIIYIYIYIHVYKCECVCVSKLQEYWWSMIFDDDLALLKPLKQEEGLVEHL